MKNELATISSDELTKVKENRLNAQQLQFLLQKTPQSHIYERPAKGGGKWKYVTGTYVKKVLNMMFGWDWDFEILEYKYDLDLKQVYVLGKLTCRTNGRAIVKTQFGRQDIKFKKSTSTPLDLGNDLKAAATDCLKKCASEIGVASDVYAPNEFRAINVIDSDYEKKRLKELKNKISEILDQNQDTEEKQSIIDMMLAKEEAGEATIEFFENLIADQLEKGM